MIIFSCVLFSNVFSTTSICEYNIKYILFTVNSFIFPVFWLIFMLNVYFDNHWLCYYSNPISATRAKLDACPKIISCLPIAWDLIVIDTRWLFDLLVRYTYQFVPVQFMLNVLLYLFMLIFVFSSSYCTHIFKWVSG